MNASATPPKLVVGMFYVKKVPSGSRVCTEIWLWFSMIFQDKTTLLSKLFKVFYTSLYKQNTLKTSFISLQLNSSKFLCFFFHSMTQTVGFSYTFYGMFSFCLCKQRIYRCLKWADILLQPRFLLFSVPQCGQIQPSSFSLIVLLQLFSLTLQGTSCISVTTCSQE